MAYFSVRNSFQEKQYETYLERNNLLLDVIRLKAPISKYGLAKITGLSYTTVKQITKEFVFVGLVFLRTEIGENGLPVKLVCIKKEDQDE